MASSMWSALEGNGPSIMSSSNSAGVGMMTMDPATLLNNQLASALSTMGDAQYWEESISPTAIRQSLSEADPSNPTPTHTASLLKCMKWLLASISKGRNVSDFYPHVVKLAGAVRLEVRKMVYMYLVQYADYDATTRELSLLSINAFQRGLSDAEPLIRALALRVLTSIRLPDILQIQVLGVQTCARDKSPYVRKCAANALAKLHPRCPKAGPRSQHDVLIQVMQEMLETDECTMVLTSAYIAFSELCPERLDLLSGSFRKTCHLLTDMDEWGQVVVLDVLARYCRCFFRQPAAWLSGTAERIDAERRVRRTVVSPGICSLREHKNKKNNNSANSGSGGTIGGSLDTTSNTATSAAGDSLALPPRTIGKKVKRRVVKKGFYSDEEDESTDEEAYVDPHTGHTIPSVSAALREKPAAVLHTTNNVDDDEDADLDVDHRLLLTSAMPLLKSRNAGVVLAVCSLHYYCGVSSVKVRSAIGRALVRIHRDNREIQYVVLCSIRTLAAECPSAFLPFLPDFFIKALDPPFTKFIKLDVLVSLALEPKSIESVLDELRTYVRDGHRPFACSAIRAVGRVAEMARIVYDRHGAKTGNTNDALEERRQANRIALNCVYGLLTLTQTSDKKVIVGEAVVVTQWILQMLQSDAGGDYSGGGIMMMSVDDPNQVQKHALRRLLVLLIYSLSKRVPDEQPHGNNNNNDDDNDNDSDDDDDDHKSPPPSRLDKICVNLPPPATASALWIIGEFLSPLSKNNNSSKKPVMLDVPNQAQVRLEILRLVARAFPELTSVEKEQGIHLATKWLLLSLSPPPPSSSSSSPSSQSEEAPLCEHVLAMGRVDVDANVRDRARHESALLRLVGGLHHDVDALEDVPAAVVLKSNSTPILTLENVKRILLQTNKPAPSSIPLLDGYRTHSDESDGFRFGTLSSLVGHRARSAYIPLPPWADRDSPSSLRDQPEVDKRKENKTVGTAGGGAGAGSSTSLPRQQQQQGGGFYETEPSSSSSDDDSSSESSSSSDNDNKDSSGSSEDSDSSEDSSSDESNDLLPMQKQQQQQQQPAQQRQIMPTISPSGAGIPSKQTVRVQDVNESSSSSGDDDSSSEEDSSSSDSDSDDGRGQLLPMSSSGEASKQSLSSMPGQLIPMGSGGGGKASKQHFSASSVSDDLKGLVLSPVVVSSEAEPTDPNFDRDSSSWIQLIRPEHAAGLSVQGRYLRGITKTKQAELLALADKPSFVCLQFRFENRKTDGGSIRRLRVMQRSSSVSSSSTIGPNRVVAPPEIEVLSPGKKVECVIGIDFAGISDRDGSLQAKLDLKFGSGGIPIEIKPSLGDLLLPCKRSVDDFDAAVRAMHGFQRVESTFSVADSNARSALPEKLTRNVALWPVTGGGGILCWKDDKLRLVGTLPASSDPVYVLVMCQEDAKQGQLVVCCDHALAVNSIMNQAKRAVQES